MTGQIRVFNSTNFTVEQSLMNAACLTGMVEIPTIYALVHHGSGVVLIDAGYRPSVPDPTAVGVTAVPDALAGEGLRPEEVTHVVLTHLHVDHVGWLDLFGDAELVCQEAELEYARAPDLEPMIAEYPPWADLCAREWSRVEGDYDLLGDGSISLLATPGHTPGHQSVLVRIGARPTLFAGDAIWTEECLYPEVMPGLLWDAHLYVESRERLRAEATAVGARWIHSHERSTAFARSRFG